MGSRSKYAKHSLRGRMKKPGRARHAIRVELQQIVGMESAAVRKAYRAGEVRVLDTAGLGEVKVRMRMGILQAQPPGETGWYALTSL